ncbi:MAG: copper chaperone CopZ [Cyclobacteriaceae bacterium]|jgi:copper chaperone CopZ
METKYAISGMTCDGCVSSVKNILETTSGIEEAKVQLAYPQAIINSEEAIDLAEINQLLRKKGNYTISKKPTRQDLPPMPGIKRKKTDTMLPEISFNTYKPLIIIVAFIAGVSLLVQYPFQTINSNLWMRHFMAGFFLVFSFFKLLNISGFASSYKMYDIIAVKFPAWGYIYPFVELGLGIAYLINFNPTLTNWLTIIILGISSIGVIESNINKRKIKCACLGDVFNLPMSTVTIIEDLTMVAMAVLMLL